MNPTPPVNPMGIPTETKTKTRTKAIAGTAALIVGAGILAAVIVQQSNNGYELQCNSGSRAGQSCMTNRDCNSGSPSDSRAKCVRVPVRTAPRTRDGGVPDLIASRVTFDSVSRLPSVKVSNQGTGTATWLAPNTLQVNVQWLPDLADPRFAPGSVLGGATNGSATESLARDQATTVTFTTPTYAVPEGATRARICVDVGTPGVSESNEENNCWEGPLPPLLPDLIVESVRFDAVTRFPTITIKNQGSSVVSWTSATPPQAAIQFLNSAEATMPLPLRASNGRIVGYGLGFAITRLAPGETFTRTWTPGTPGIPSSIPREAVAARLNLDTEVNRVIESNEGNNTWTGPVPAVR